MAQFPRREPEVVVLANTMLAGYKANPVFFPRSDVSGLADAIAAYKAAKSDQQEKMSRAQLATEVKEARLAELKAFMTNQLRQSEVDTAAHPKQLALIGWGPKSAPSPSPPPGQPRNLMLETRDSTLVLLDWRAPAAGTGGKVRSYILERRETPPGGGAFGEWHQIATALEREITLEEQPTGQRLEYRVIAVNVGGASHPTNSVTVVLG